MQRTNGIQRDFRRGSVVAAITVVTVAVLVGVTPPALGASDALNVHGKYTFDFGTSTGEGTFVATGTSVTDGAVCHTGSASQVFVVESVDAQGPNHVTGVDTYTCDDGSGSIQIQFDARRTKAGQASNHFDVVACVVGGDGDYADLDGVASGSAHPNLKNQRLTMKYDFAELGPADCPLDG